MNIYTEYLRRTLTKYPYMSREGGYKITAPLMCFSSRI